MNSTAAARVYQDPPDQRCRLDFHKILKSSNPQILKSSVLTVRSPVPPRFAYWTILIDSKPTAFRAQKQEDLLPTFKQLQRTNPDIVMKWFARGRIWESPEQARWAAANKPKRRERRSPDWRPGGEHADPRMRTKHQRPARSVRHGGSQGSRPPRRAVKRPPPGRRRG
jgi:hypothetical protein